MAAKSSEPNRNEREEGLYKVVFFQEFLQELRAARRREDVLTFGFALLLVALIAAAVLAPGEPHIVKRAIAVAGLLALGWRINTFLSDNRNRQNSIKKVITATEHSYPFPQDRAFVRLPDFKNLDGPGDWDKSDYSLADWDRSEYSVFLKVLLLAAAAAVLVL